MLKIKSTMFIRGSRRFIIILTRGLGLYEILSEYFRRIICNQICIMGMRSKNSRRLFFRPCVPSDIFYCCAIKNIYANFRLNEK